MIDWEQVASRHLGQRQIEGMISKDDDDKYKSLGPKLFDLVSERQSLGHNSVGKKRHSWNYDQTSHDKRNRK